LLAEECARLLRIGREDGVKSQGKSKKREDAQGIKHREWLVWLPEDKVSKLKYSTITLIRMLEKLMDPQILGTMYTVALN
jgi:hypothetical protein